MRPFSLRLWKTLVLACATALALTACERDALHTPDAASAATSTHDPGAAFPITLNSALGPAVITARPQRVVTLGLGADDIVVALGITPVGVARADWGGDGDGYWPWVRAAITERGDALPKPVAAYPELDIEAIIALQPDVVLAPFSGVSPEAFRQLSQLVPVVAYPERQYLTPIDTQIDLIAAALGKRSEAEPLKQRIHAKLASAATQYPRLAGKTFAYVRVDPRTGNLGVYVAGDPRVDTLVGMGMRLAPSVAQLEASSGSFSYNLGLEHADRLSDADMLVTWFYSDADRQRATVFPLYTRIAAIQRGSDLALTDASLVMASSSGAPLAVDWMLDRLGPQLQEAAARATP